MARRKDPLGDAARTILSLPPGEKEREKLRARGVPEEAHSLGAAMVLSLYEKALEGQYQAVKELRSILRDPEEERLSDREKRAKVRRLELELKELKDAARPRGESPILAALLDALRNEG